ncbi:EVE domain-containing protein [Gammaproteobacteria bacterium]|nr:EVE domain-containing protein [Gammaproteobacteria bacterium]
MKYWLFKSEPTTFSIDDLLKSPKQTTHWDGVRNFQVRNMMRDAMNVGDLAFFYHSNCKPPGITGVVEIVKKGYPDFSAWDPSSKYFDTRSTPQKSLWYMVDVKFVKKFNDIISLDSLKSFIELSDMLVVRRGNRLSITPVEKSEWDFILSL